MLQKLFNPKAVAIIGASSEPGKVGFALMKNLMEGASRKLYPITLSGENVLGLPSYKLVNDVVDSIDLAVIAVPAASVPSVLKDCGKKKIPFVVIISAGFGEVGREGRNLENDIKKIARKYRIKILGPNCLGVLDMHAGLNATFCARAPLKGSIAFISQSGALASAIFDWGRTEGLGFSKFVSLGNEAGLTETDILKYLANDRDTNAIIMYLERVTDGRKFFELAKRIMPRKPIALIKAGRGKKGAAAVASHTGSLVPSDSVFEAACAASYVISAKSLHELFGLAKLFKMGITAPVTNIAILTNGGGPSILAADLIEQSVHLELVELREAAKTALRKALPPMAAVSNPVDIIGDAPALRYEKVLQILAAEKNVDGIIVMLTPQMMTESEKTVDVLLAFKASKALIPVFMGGEAVFPALQKIKDGGLANFGFAEDVVVALNALNSRYRKKIPSATHSSDMIKPTLLGFSETKKIFARYGIPLEGKLARKRNEVGKVLRGLSPPFAIKVSSPDVIHKTELGAVVLNIATPDEALSAWDTIMKKVRTKLPKAKIEGMVIEEMRKGKEVIIGLKRDPVFGPVVVFGLGGIFTEILEDVSMRLAPVNKRDAEEMIKEIRGFPLLRGMRGEKSVDMKALTRLIVNVSRLGERKEINEADLNPVIVDSKKASVVDARIIRYRK